MEIEKNEFNNLFGKINALIAKYRKINEITGENFNVFRILKLESSEVRMHSAFLAELLNPRGSHGQKDIFLKLFIKAFCFKGNDIDSSTCEVIIEKHTGFLNNEKTEGGRLDILIRDGNHNQIVIENKIYAGDQTNQLTRYYLYANNADILYLTLNGSAPSKNSYGNLEIDRHFKCISYKTQIIDWLIECRKEMAVIPLIRESISQYINLIKYLTNQTLNSNMQEELSDIIKSNLKASFSISGNLDQTLKKISDEFGVLVKETIANDEISVSYKINFNNNYTGIWIWKKEWKYVKIGFQFQSKNINMIYGFTAINNPYKTPLPDELKLKLKSLPNNEKKNNDWWPYFVWMEEPYGSWNKYAAYSAIADGSMLAKIIEKTNMLFKMTEGLIL